MLSQVLWCLHPDPFTRRVHPFPAAVIVGYGFAVSVPSILTSGSAFGDPIPDTFLMVFQESNKILYVEAL